MQEPECGEGSAADGAVDNSNDSNRNWFSVATGNRCKCSVNIASRSVSCECGDAMRSTSKCNSKDMFCVYCMCDTRLWLARREKIEIDRYKRQNYCEQLVSKSKWTELPDELRCVFGPSEIKSFHMPKKFTFVLMEKLLFIWARVCEIEHLRLVRSFVSLLSDNVSRIRMQMEEQCRIRTF